MKTIGAVFAALALTASTQVKASIPTSDPMSQETKKQALPVDNRKKVQKKQEIDPQGLTNDGMFRLAFHSSPIFSPTRSQRIKNKLNRKYYK